MKKLLGNFPEDGQLTLYSKTKFLYDSYSSQISNCIAHLSFCWKRKFIIPPHKKLGTKKYSDLYQKLLAIGRKYTKDLDSVVLDVKFIERFKNEMDGIQKKYEEISTNLPKVENPLAIKKVFSKSRAAYEHYRKYETWTSEAISGIHTTYYDRFGSSTNDRVVGPYITQYDQPIYNDKKCRTSNYSPEEAFSVAPSNNEVIIGYSSSWHKSDDRYYTWTICSLLERFELRSGSNLGGITLERESTQTLKCPRGQVIKHIESSWRGGSTDDRKFNVKCAELVDLYLNI